MLWDVIFTELDSLDARSQQARQPFSDQFLQGPLLQRHLRHAEAATRVRIIFLVFILFRLTGLPGPSGPAALRNMQSTGFQHA